MKLKTDNPLLLVPFRFGLIGALMNILALLVPYYLGRHPLLLNIVLDARLPLYALFIFISIKAYKEQCGQGLHFWQGMTIGLVVYLLMGTLTSLFVLVFSAIPATGFLQQYIHLAMQQLMANKEIFIENIGEKTYYDTLAHLPSTSALDLSVDYLLKSMPIGLFLTLIEAILFRKRNFHPNR